MILHKVFYDWEFDEDGTTIKPISLGMVNNFNNELYLINQDYFAGLKSGINKPNEFVREHVLSKISPEDVDRYGVRHNEFKYKILDFVTINRTSNLPVELWGYFVAYDHVLLSQCWGRMIDLPCPPIPMYSNDLISLHYLTGQGIKPEQPVGQHNALVDARWNRDFYNSIRAAQ